MDPTLCGRYHGSKLRRELRRLLCAGDTMDPKCAANCGGYSAREIPWIHSVLPTRAITITKKLIFKMSNQNHCCSAQLRPRQTAKTNPGNISEKNIYTQSCPLRQKLADKMSNQNHCCSEQHRQRQTVSQVSHVHADVALRRRHDAWSSYDDMCMVTPVTPTPSVSRPRRRRRGCEPRLALWFSYGFLNHNCEPRLALWF